MLFRSLFTNNALAFGGISALAGCQATPNPDDHDLDAVLGAFDSVVALTADGNGDGCVVFGFFNEQVGFEVAAGWSFILPRLPHLSLPQPVPLKMVAGVS